MSATRSAREDQQAAVRRHARTIRILQCLQAGPVFNARELACHFQVSKRTIYRDLRLLRAAGVQLLFDEEHSAYRMSASYPGDIAPPQLTMDDLVMIFLAANCSPLQSLASCRAATKEAMARMLLCYAGDFRSPMARLLQSCDIEVASPALSDIDHANMLVILQAISRRRLVKAMVLAHDCWRRVELAMYQFKFGEAGWQLVARETAEGKTGVLRMDEVRDVELTDFAYTLPKGFRARPPEACHIALPPLLGRPALPRGPSR